MTGDSFNFPLPPESAPANDETSIGADWDEDDCIVDVSVLEGTAEIPFELTYEPNVGVDWSLSETGATLSK